MWASCAAGGGRWVDVAERPGVRRQSPLPTPPSPPPPPPSTHPPSTGTLTVPVPAEDATITVHVQRAHLEEDAGKLVHAGSAQLSGADHSLVDYNRAGVPLLEVVSGPDMRSGAQAAAYGAELRRVMTYAGVSDAAMQDGGMRCDVNVSVRVRGDHELGTKVEIKNMNSFSAMQRAIDWEVARQVGLMAAGRGAGGVQALVDAKGLGQISDPAALEALVDGVLVANPKQLAQFRAGKTKLQASDGRGACGVGGSWGGWRGRGVASGGLPRAPPHPARRHAPPAFRPFLWGNS